MDKLIREKIEDKKILHIDHTDSFDCNKIVLILEDGMKVEFDSLTGISVSVKK